jgi:hypothetical protein
MPTSLDAVVARAMQKDIEARYQSWEEFSHDLAQSFRNKLLVSQRQAFPDSEKFESLRGLSFFREFTDVNLWEVVRFSRWDEVAAGTVIMRDGERGDFFAFLLDGELAVSKCGHTLGHAGRPESALARWPSFVAVNTCTRRRRRGADRRKGSHGIRAGTAACLRRLPDALLPGLSRRHRRAFGRRQRATRGTLTPDLRAHRRSHRGTHWNSVQPPFDQRPVAGGSIHQSPGALTMMNAEVFREDRRHAPRTAMFAAEASGIARTG